MLLYLLVIAGFAHAADYACTTEFGETVPLSRTLNSPGGKSVSAAWNEAARAWAGPTEVKRKIYHRGELSAELETRYLTRSGPDFGLRITCAAGGEKCRGAFSNGAEVLLLSTRLFDIRTPAEGSAELRLGSREHLGLIVRVRKSSVAAGQGPPRPVSASGELKIYREDPLFIQDVGADEALDLRPGWVARIAALELKIRCRRLN